MCWTCLVSTCLCGFHGQDIKTQPCIQYDKLEIKTLLFAEGVLLAPCQLDLRHTHECFAAECEAAVMKISTSKSKLWFSRRKSEMLHSGEGRDLSFVILGSFWEVK